MDTQKLIEAFELGKRFAYKNRVGRQFFGSMQIAKKLYKGIDNPCADVFMSGHWKVMQSFTICINPEINRVSGFISESGKLIK